MLLDHFLEDVPHNGILLFDQLLGLLDGGAVAAEFETVIDERLEQLQRHLLRQAGLVELELGADDDDGAAGVVDAFAEQILAEAALLALQCVGERFKRTVVGAAQHAAAAAVVEQSVHRFLQHALFVAHDDVGRVQLNELLQPVVAVDHAAVEVVEVGRGEAAAVQRHQRTEFRRNHRNHIEDHPLGLVARFAEALDHSQPLGELELLLLALLRLHPLADFNGKRFDIDFAEQLLDAFGAHHGDELARILRFELALLFIGDHFAAIDGRHFSGIDDDVRLEVEDALQVAEGDVEQVADARRQAFEEPDVRAGAGELDVAEALAAHTAQGHFDAALVADDAAVLHALVLAAQALPVRDGAEDAGAEQAVPLRLEGTVVDGLGLGHLTV